MKDIVVYPTSIVPEGSALEPLRDTKILLSSMQIEVIHIACFIFIMFCILGASWFALKKVSATETKKAPAGNAGADTASPLTA